ncbi:hypothetical protein Tco_0807404 [Tanacetum coccineum]
MITTVQSVVKIAIQQHEQAVQKKQEEQAAFTPYWKFPIFDDDDDEYTIQYKEYLENSSNAITPDLSTEEPDNSLSMGDEHLDTISETESDEVILSSVRRVICPPIPVELLRLVFPNIDSLLEEFASELAPINQIPPGIHEADFDPEEDIRLIETIYFVRRNEKLLNINLLIAKIEALKDNPTPSTDSVLKSPSSFPNSFLEETDTSDNSLPESEIFCFDMEEKSSGNPTSHSDLSLPDYEAFYCDNEPDSENFTIDVVEDIFDNPTRELYVHVPNVFPTHLTLYLDSDFAPSDDSLGSDLVVSFPSGTRNKIFDPGIFIKVQSKRFLSPNEFSISFICDPLSPVFDTLLLFSSKNKEKVFNPGSLSSNEEKSPHLLSHRGFNPSKIISDFSESPMMISGGDIPILDVPFLHFYPP